MFISIFLAILPVDGYTTKSVSHDQIIQTTGHHCRLRGTKLHVHVYCLLAEVHVYVCEQHARSRYVKVERRGVETDLLVAILTL